MIDVPRRRRRDTPYTGIVLFSRTEPLTYFAPFNDQCDPCELASFIRRAIFRGSQVPRALASTLSRRTLNAVAAEWRTGGVIPPAMRVTSPLNADWALVKRAEDIYQAAFHLLQEEKTTWEEAVAITEGLENIIKQANSTRVLGAFYGPELEEHGWRRCDKQPT